MAKLKFSGRASGASSVKRTNKNWLGEQGGNKMSKRLIRSKLRDITQKGINTTKSRLYLFPIKFHLPE